MRGFEAIFAALAMLQDPNLARAARRCPLPKGVTLLLETAAGEAEALCCASAATGRSQAALKQAAGFFIEQVLLSAEADSYRVLGADREALAGELRRHMALLMRWLHPDLVANGAPGPRFDRSAFAGRVTKAWESIKTPERREAYDAACASAGRPSRKASGHGNLPAPGEFSSQILLNPIARGQRQLKVYRLQRESFWNRLLLLLGGRP